MEITHLIESAGELVDLMGVVAIVGGILITTIYFVYNLLKRQPFTHSYQQYRHGIGRALLLGLEILVAADIIRTVAISPTFESIGVLALIVIVRTFLSWSLDLELKGHWPWQHPDTAPKKDEE